MPMRATTISAVLVGALATSPPSSPPQCYASLGGLAANEGSHIASHSSTSLVDCMTLCDAQSTSCNSFTYKPSESACYLKAQVHSASSTVLEGSRSVTFTTYYVTNCPPPPPSSPQYTHLGGGYCRHGLLRRTAGCDLAECTARCDLEADCFFVSVHVDLCALYAAQSNQCTSRSGGGGHQAYARPPRMPPSPPSLPSPLSPPSPPSPPEPPAPPPSPIAPGRWRASKHGPAGMWEASGSQGDPHLALAHGARADFRGRHGAIFNFLSTQNLSLNVRTKCVVPPA